MIRHFAIACGAMLVLCSVVHGADEYQRVVCIDDPCFGVTLLIKRSATPADEAFVGFELHNRTDRPVRLFGGATRYDFRNVTARPVGMAPEAAGAGVARSMGSGNEHDLLKREGDGAKADVIQPGTIRRMRYVSAYAVGGLGWPPEGGFTVQGRAHFTVSSEDRLHLETPRQGVAFSFEWMPPDEKGMATTRARLKELVEHPKDWLGDSFVLRVLLGNRDVASAVSVEELLAGLRRAEQPVWPILREHIDANYADKEQVLTFWLEVIKARDHLLIRELAESRNVRSVKEGLDQPLDARRALGRGLASRVPWMRRAWVLS